MRLKYFCLLAVLIYFSISPAFAEVNIRFFYAGDGNAILVSSDHDHVLIDTGDPVTAVRLTTKLKNITNKLSALIITHPHQDHIGGVFNILEGFPQVSRYDNGEFLPNEAPYWWYKDFFRVKNYKSLVRGVVLSFNDFTIDVLSPPKEKFANDWNKNSLVLRLNVGSFCALLMGDALIETEEFLISKKEKLNCPIIQVGHHGSKYASSKEFIKQVNPEMAIVSVSKNSRHGYPDKQVIKSWREAGEVWFTDQKKDVLVTISKNGDYLIEKKRE